MKCCLFCVVLLGLTQMVKIDAHYEEAYVEDLCKNQDTGIWNLGSDSSNSSGILKASRSGTYLKGMNCTIIIQPPLGYGVILSVRHLDFRPYHYPSCKSYVKVSQIQKPATLCGYSHDPAEYQSYFTDAKALEIQFFTLNNTGSNFHSQISFTVTSFLRLNYNCDMKMFLCRTDKCIWKGLKCDGHNNCGDLSDESRNANCGMMPAGVIAGVVVASVFLFLLIILIPVVYCRYSNNRHRRFRSSSREPVIQSTQTYGSSTLRTNIQSTEPPLEPGTSYPRYQDLPPPYKP